MKKILLLLLLCPALLKAQDSIPSFVKDSIDGYIARGMKNWQIPGVSVAIVKNGKLVFIKGYGVTKLGSTEAVDENTLFMIGSNSKAFTGTALAMLEADKKISLDDKVKKWLPWFKVYDPWVTENMIVKDLMSHRMGYETFQGDFMYFDSDLSKEQLFEKFGKLKPDHPFRTKWGYTNAGFAVAGEVLKAAGGMSWAEFLRSRIFSPLQMTRTLALSSEIKTATNKCFAHTVVNGQVKLIPYGDIDNMAPAGAISSSAKDLSNWVTALLANGNFEGKQVIPTSAINQTRFPHSVLGNGGYLYNKGHFNLYGLGWFMEEYCGRKIVSHTGGVNGFVTSVTLIPEEKTGIIVLTNTDMNAFYESLKWEIMDAYLGNQYRNYDKTYFAQQTMQEKQQQQWLDKKRDTIAQHPKTSLPLKDFAGTYVHAIYGKMTIALEKDSLIARFEHHKGRYAVLEALGEGRFLATFSDPLYGIKVWPFTIKNGKIENCVVTVADFVEHNPYEFIKQTK